MSTVKSSSDSGDNDKQNWVTTGCFPHRYKLAVMSAVGLALVVGSRTCFALVMTHVTSGSNASDAAAHIISKHCTVTNTSRDLQIDMAGDTMFLLHAAYSAGLTVGKLPGSVLAMRCSAKRMISLSLFVTSALTVSLPVVIRFSTGLVFLVRITQGLIEGIQQPATLGMLSAWSTSTDNARLASIFMAGCSTAPIIASLLAGSALCYFSWNFSFYIYGVLGTTWCVAWLLFFHDTPDLHPRLSHVEREYHKIYGCSVKSSSKQLLHSIPWRRLLTCPSLYAVFVGSVSRNLLFSFMVFEQPQYLRDAFKLTTIDIGIISTLPYIGLTITCTLGGFFSDQLLRYGINKTFTRKLAYTLGNGTEALCFIGLYFTSNWRMAVSLICIGTAGGGLAFSGYLPLPSDVAPQYAGVITGLAMIGTLGAVVSPLLASFLAGITKTLQDWQQLFLITGLLHVTDVIVFNILAKAELQPWASGLSDTQTKVSLAAQASESLDDYEETALLADESGETPSIGYGTVKCIRVKPKLFAIHDNP